MVKQVTVKKLAERSNQLSVKELASYRVQSGGLRGPESTLGVAIDEYNHAVLATAQIQDELETATTLIQLVRVWDAVELACKQAVSLGEKFIEVEI